MRSSPSRAVSVGEESEQEGAEQYGGGVSSEQEGEGGVLVREVLDDGIISAAGVVDEMTGVFRRLSKIWENPLLRRGRV